MNCRAIVTASLLACLAGGSIGCEKGGSAMQRLGRAFRLEKKPGPEKQVSQLYLGKTGDERREALVAVSSQDWGLQEPYPAKYASMLKDDPDPSVRGAAAGALGRSGQVKYLPDVVAGLEDESARVRWDSAAALDILIGPAAVDPLRKHATEDTSTDVRAACAKALRNYREKPVVRTLMRCLGDDAFAVRHRAHSSLAEMTGRDLGYDPEKWAELSDEELAATRPARPPRPRWDLLGLTNRRAPRPAPAPAAETPKRPARPWWDLLGVTAKKPQPPQQASQ